MKLSAWLRRAATRTAELESSLLQKEGTVWDISPKQTAQEVKDRIYPQSRKKCHHRVNPGAWCKKCLRVK